VEKKNITSYIRTGFHFQDLYAVYVISNWLKKKNSYKWIRFETIPVELSDKEFYLDDIILLDENDEYHFYQIKHKSNQEGVWEWKDFLDKKKLKSGHSDSLFEKWYRSYFKDGMNTKTKFAAFVTNTKASPNIQKFIKDDKIEISVLKEEDAELYNQILQQLKDEAKISEFFSNFSFIFDESSLETKIEVVLIDELRVTRNGEILLLSKVKEESRKEITRNIYLDEILSWCEFDNPRPLNENFDIPLDFELFDERIHDYILNTIKNPDGGVCLIYGKPGSGKSTYLSYLFKDLKEKKIPVIRHHYHISPNDTSPNERLQAERVVEALKAEFKNYDDLIGHLSDMNSSNVKLMEFINEMSLNSFNNGLPWVLIIDGLDHVVRNVDDDELKNFLQEIAFPQRGLWIILGTQENAIDLIPTILLDKISTEHKIEIKGLQPIGVKNIILHNTLGLQLPDNDDITGSLIDSIYHITEGNALHLRYTLSSIKLISKDGYVNEYDLRELQPYSGDIEKYYESLWKQLSDLSKSIAIVLNCVDFEFTEEQLFEFLASIFDKPNEISNGYQSVRHLLNIKRNRINVFHNSFRLFVNSVSEFNQQIPHIRKELKQWLENCKFEDLKWSELKRLSYFLGDSHPIMSINRKWLLDSIFDCRDERNIINQLDLGIKASFEQDDFPKCSELGVLSSYFSNIVNHNRGNLVRIWESTIEYNFDINGSYNFSDLDTEQIIKLLELFRRHHRLEDVYSEAFDILMLRVGNEGYHKKDFPGASLPELPAALLRIISMDSNHDVQRVYEYVKQYRRDDWSSELFAYYANSLLDFHQFDKVRELLKKELVGNEQKEILTVCAQYDIKNGFRNFASEILEANVDNKVGWILLYELLYNGKVVDLPPLIDFDSMPENVEEYSVGRSERVSFFCESYMLAIVYAHLGMKAKLLAWNNNAYGKWVGDVIAVLNQFGIYSSERLQINEAIDFSHLENLLSDVRFLRFPQDRDILEFQRSFMDSLTEIFRVIYFLNNNTKNNTSFNSDIVLKCLDNPFVSENGIIEIILRNNLALLDKYSYKIFIEKVSGRISNSIYELDSRARDYIKLSNICKIHNDLVSSHVFLKLAIDNMMGYGVHKDLFLDLIVKSIRYYSKYDPNGAINFLYKISAEIEQVTEYTDGDETRHLPEFLGECLSEIDISIFRKYYFWNAKNENLYLVESLYSHFLKALDYAQPIELAIASTTTNYEGLQTLKRVSETNTHAQMALLNIESYLGTNSFTSEAIEERPYSVSSIHPENIKPQELSLKLTENGESWQNKDFLNAWIKHWILTSNDQNLDALSAVMSYINLVGIKEIDSETLFNLLEVLIKIDKEKAFEYLYWSQANNGWETYWRNAIFDKSRWRFLKQNFPERYREFFTKSIINTGKKYGKGNNYFFPGSKGIEFLLFFDEKENVKAIIESYVSSLKLLMADMKLATPLWQGIREVSNLDILLQRLLNPSPLTKERAANEIANLLINKSVRESVYAGLLKWIKSQTLESIIVLGLLPIIRFLQIRNDISFQINLNEIARCITITSIVIEKVFEEIGLLLHIETRLIPVRFITASIPADYKVDDFFIKYIGLFVARVYNDTAMEISKISGRNFIKEWSFEFERLIKELKLKKDTSNVERHYGSMSTPKLMGWSTLLSEVYRTSFIRILQGYNKNDPERYLYVDAILKTMPIDLSFWKVYPSRIPDWWPCITYEVRGKDEYKSILSMELDFNFERLLDNIRNGKRIIGIEGALRPNNGWDNNINLSSFSLIGFGYSVKGKNIPEPEEIADEFFYNVTRISDPFLTERPFSILDSRQNIIPGRVGALHCDDIDIYPLVSRVDHICINLWQWFRFYWSPFEIDYKLVKTPEIRIENTKWNYFKEGKVIASSSDWLEGLGERYDFGQVFPFGHYIEIDDKFLNEYLDKYSLRLGYILKVTHVYRDKYSRKESENINRYEYIKLSKIITDKSLFYGNS
jgi:Cdc6-like AAA superfamily ATPase